MKLRELIEAVKEKKLTKDQLEDYRDNLSSLFAEMQLELAEIEKEKALFFDKTRETFAENVSDISIKRDWQATDKGLREIELKRYCLATKEMLNSLRSRLYSIY
jgi:hypothetical protein